MMPSIKSLINHVSLDTWVIKKSENKYYQFRNLDYSKDSVNLKRFSLVETVTLNQFNHEYRLASPEEVKQHLEYLTSKLPKPNTSLRKIEFRPEQCSFYMLTVTGDNGSKVRHSTFEQAATEATRLAKKMNHQVHILGVVATVDVTEIKTKLITHI